MRVDVSDPAVAVDVVAGEQKVATLTAEHLQNQEVRQVFVANRSHERAIELARRFRGEAIRYDEVEQHLEACDIVIASTAAPHFVIEASQGDRRSNVLQARVLRAMCRGHTNISVVGDDAQSIYSFRGASFRNILDFPR